MNSEDVFLTGLIVLSVVNLFIWMTSIENFTLQSIGFGAIMGLLVTALIIGVLSGVSIFGSGLNSSSIKIVFGVATLMNLLFSITIGGSTSNIGPTGLSLKQMQGIDPLATTGIGFQLGLGLATNVINIFSNPANDFYGVGYMFSWIFALVVFASGLIIIIRSST